MLKPVMARDKADMRAELIRNPDPELVKELWSSLCKKVSCHAFLDESWMTTWFQTISQHLEPILIVVKDFDSGSVLGLAIIHILHRRRRFFFQRKIVYFNEIPFQPHDMVIEYNGILADADNYDRVWSSTLATLASELEWDEIKINKIDPQQLPSILSAISGLQLEHFFEREDSSPYATLAKNKSWEKAEKLNISSNRRRQIRKSKKMYEELYGEISIKNISKPDDVDSFWKKMDEMHTQAWTARGDKGAFANQTWNTFNRNIIQNWLESGHVQLTRYKAGTTVIGYLFNMISGNRVYNIQSAFRFESDNKLKPGFLCHYLCMQLCYQNKLDAYYYLAGGEDYKKSLSANVDTLSWVCIRKSNKPFLVEDFLVNAVRYVRKLLGSKNTSDC